MCFAKFLQLNDYTVHFLGLFDAVSHDAGVEAIIKTLTIPMNVECCYHVYRSPGIGSRNTTMNSPANKNAIGKKWENGNELMMPIPFGKFETSGGYLFELPGSHAAMGGFPDEKGPGDGPIIGQGDPNSINMFHPNKEVTAWWLGGNILSSVAVAKGVLRDSLVPQTKPIGFLENSSDDWYRSQPSNLKSIPKEYRVGREYPY